MLSFDAGIQTQNFFVVKALSVLINRAGIPWSLKLAFVIVIPSLELAAVDSANTVVPSHR